MEDSSAKITNAQTLVDQGHISLALELRKATSMLSDLTGEIASMKKSIEEIRNNNLQTEMKVLNLQRQLEVSRTQPPQHFITPTIIQGQTPI